VKANANQDGTSIGQGADPNDKRFAPALVQKDELYDLDSDPLEQHNLADKLPKKLAEMRAELEHIMK
jgi:hypothetical protein